MYWLSEVALYTGVPESTLKRWTGQISSAKAIIDPPPDCFQQRKGEARLSFANLLETHILDATRKHDIPIQRLRWGLDYLKGQFPNAAHPLLDTTFYSLPGARDVFTRTLEGDTINLSRQGQRALSEILQEHLRRIEWDQSGPIRLMPIALTAW